MLPTKIVCCIFPAKQIIYQSYSFIIKILIQITLFTRISFRNIKSRGAIHEKHFLLLPWYISEVWKYWTKSKYVSFFGTVLNNKEYFMTIAFVFRWKCKIFKRHSHFVTQRVKPLKESTLCLVFTEDCFASKCNIKPTKMICVCAFCPIPWWPFLYQNRPKFIIYERICGTTLHRIFYAVLDESIPVYTMSRARKTLFQ